MKTPTFHLNRILPYWVAATITAFVSIAYAKLFAWSEEQSFVWAAFSPALGFLIIPFGILASTLFAHFFSPEAAGSGIPQMIAAVELGKQPSKTLDRLLSFPMMIVKVLASSLCVACGGITGREGPNLQVAAAIFHQVGKFWPKTLEKVNGPSMILAGGAAGLAAAFNTPLGGIVFAIEELAKVHISHVRTTVFHSVIIAGLFAQAIFGNYLYLEKISVPAIHWAETGELAFAGILIGFLGGVFGWAIVKVLRWRSNLKLSSRLTVTVVCGFLVAGLFYSVGNQNLGSGRTLIIDLLKHPDSHASLLLSFARGFGNFFTFAGGVVGGIFAPALSTGACFGSWMSQLFPETSLQLWILAGMVAFLTGVTRTPFTSLILVLEMTDSHAVIIDLMLVAVLAHAAAWVVDKTSFYEHIASDILKAAGIPHSQSSLVESDLLDQSINK